MFTYIYLAEIMRLSAEISDGDLYTVFCDYSGHVKSLHIRVYEGKKGAWRDEENCIFDIHIYTDSTESNNALKQIIVQLTQLLR